MYIICLRSSLILYFMYIDVLYLDLSIVYDVCIQYRAYRWPVDFGCQACVAGHEEVVRLLLSSRAYAQGVPGAPSTPLHRL